MRNKILLAVTTLIICATMISCIFLLFQKEQKIDMVKLNELQSEIENKKQNYSQIDSQGYDIIVIAFDGAVKYTTITTSLKSYDEWMNYAYQNDCVILEFTEGRIFVFMPEVNMVETIILIISLFSTTLIIILILYSSYIKRTIFKPFKRLKIFAGEVATGNLDSPLLMDRNNAFGAFTESFDIMREELKLAQEREIALEKSKKELVAELSHDIKTPIASIKAVAELLRINEVDAKKIRNIEIIQKKATEIDNLITDMFNITLQDLSELKINIGVVSSKDIEQIIKESDYFSKIKNFALPECLIEADLIRLSQIIGNIMNNSYKYADTEIKVLSKINDGTLNLEFQDFGAGVSDDDLLLITNKFYRGLNSEGKSGAGLGLYICKIMLEKMGGSIDCYNTEDGFSVNIYLKLT